MFKKTLPVYRVYYRLAPDDRVVSVIAGHLKIEKGLLVFSGNEINGVVPIELICEVKRITNQEELKEEGNETKKGI